MKLHIFHIVRCITGKLCGVASVCLIQPVAFYILMLDGMVTFSVFSFLVLCREHNPKHEPEESTSTGLFGSLKSFAFGLRNFWKKL